MRTSAFFVAPTLALTALALTAGPVAAQTGATSYSATLAPSNNSGTSGQAMIQLQGSQATITMNIAGAAPVLMDMPFVHAQHIHIGGQGRCAGPEADANGDGVVDSPEGEPIEGAISTTLSLSGDTSPASALALDRLPAGGAYTYQRTITLDPATVQAIQSGAAIVEVHGVDPARLPAAAQQQQSTLDPSLPLAATLPAACGEIVAAQMAGAVPEGGADTGVEGIQAAEDGQAALPLAAGALLLAAGTLAGGATAWRRRNSARS